MTTTFLPDVPVTAIRPHDDNPRKELKDIDELAASVAEQGIIEPLLIAPLGGGTYRLIAGHRRLAAAKQAGLKDVPAVLRDDLDTAPKQLEAMLVENTQRTDLTPIEEADAFAQLVAFPGYTQTKAAKHTGRTPKFVKQRLALAALPEDTRKKIHGGQITLADAATIAGFVGTPEYKAVAKAAGSSNFSYTVQHARDTAKRREQITLLKAHAEAQGWKTVTEYSETGETVLAHWNHKGNLDTVLAKLTGPHVVLISDYGWGVYTPPNPNKPHPHGGRAETPEQKAAAAERQRRLDDINTARKARVSWLTGRLSTLVLKGDEQLAVLRTLARLAADEDGYAPTSRASRTAVGIPDSDAADLDAWADGLTMNEAWRAVLFLYFDAAQGGSEHGAWEHEPSIMLAAALGHAPSDIEREIVDDGKRTDG